MVDIVAIGGSAGSLPALITLLEAMPPTFDYAVVIVLHRLKNVMSEMDKVLTENANKIIIREPEDKEPIRNNNIYLAPQNYHLLIEDDFTFSLDYSELVLYSRPSIDVTFECVAANYRHRAMGILLSGANSDGANGLSMIIDYGGIGIVQDPETAEYPTMPYAAINKNKKALIQSTEQIVHSIKVLQT